MSLPLLFLSLLLFATLFLVVLLVPGQQAPDLSPAEDLDVLTAQLDLCSGQGMVSDGRVIQNDLGKSEGISWSYKTIVASDMEKKITKNL